MRNFTKTDLGGGGHYLVKVTPTELEQVTNKQPVHISSTSFLSTVMYKTGYYSDFNLPGNPQINTLVSMADGWINNGYNVGENNDRVFTYIIGAQGLVDYLNNPTVSDEYRFATEEEVVRVVMYQKHRWRNKG